MTDQGKLLLSLGSGVQPVDVPFAPASRPIESWGFGAFLDAARGGRIVSGRQLRLVGKNEIDLTDSQTRRLSETADSAEASGLGRIAAVIDGLAVDMDVSARSISLALPIAPASADSFIHAPFEGLAIVADDAPAALARPNGVGRGLAPGVLGVIGTIDERFDGETAR